MKKDLTMKKSTFVKGALVTTIGIVLSKILGILYVVPFHAIIGEKGGALYGYAYTIYLVFMSLSSAGIPLAISKVVSEYQALGYYSTKKRVFFLGKKITLFLGVISFLFIMIFAPFLARLVMGDVVGGNTISDIAFVIRVVGVAILIVPLLSVYRGYFEGHRFMGPPSISQVVEQIVRVLVIIFGSLFSIKVLHVSLTTSVGVALFGATLGAFTSYIYLVNKMFKNKNKFNEKARKVNEPIISDKVIIKKIIAYSIPFIMIDAFKSIYNYVDMVTVVKGLVNIAKYDVRDAEIIYSMLSTWAAKFNMIILSISTGIVVSLIPNLTEHVVKRKNDKINYSIKQSLNILLFLTIPMTLGISFLSKEIWYVFYGESQYGPSVLSYYIFVGLFAGLFTAIVITLQTLKDYKSVFISLISGVLVKIILNNCLLLAFYKMNVSAYYGIITASVLGYLVSFMICLVILYKKYSINFEGILKNLIDIVCGSVLMMIILLLLRFVIPFSVNSRLLNIFVILFYSVIGMIIYFIYTSKTNVIKSIFGDNLKNIIKKNRK